MAQHVRFPDADGTAALGICESLLLALTGSRIITEQDARDLLRMSPPLTKAPSQRLITPTNFTPSSPSCSAFLRARTACALGKTWLRITQPHRHHSDRSAVWLPSERSTP